MKGLEKILEGRGVQATAMRLLVLSTFAAQAAPLSLAEIETILETVDKSTISRALNLFLQKDLISEVDDGSGSRRFCRNFDLELGTRVSHVHFTCVNCHKTVCLDQVEVPKVDLPEKFTPLEWSYLIKGLCPNCRRR